MVNVGKFCKGYLTCAAYRGGGRKFKPPLKSIPVGRWVITPCRACAKQGLCDRVCPFFIYLSLHKTINLSKYLFVATEKLQHHPSSKFIAARAADNSQKLLFSTQKQVFLQGSKVIWVSGFAATLYHRVLR